MVYIGGGGGMDGRWQWRWRSTMLVALDMRDRCWTEWGNFHEIPRVRRSRKLFVAPKPRSSSFERRSGLRIYAAKDVRVWFVNRRGSGAPTRLSAMREWKICGGAIATEKIIVIRIVGKMDSIRWWWWWWWWSFRKGTQEECGCVKYCNYTITTPIPSVCESSEIRSLYFQEE